jgi:hypothetical protein
MGHSINYDDPKIENDWLADQEENVKRYLIEESINFTNILEVKWFLAPYVTVWHIKPDLWIISGDLPTDYIQDNEIMNASAAVKIFATRWLEISTYLLKGKQHPELPIGKTQDTEQLTEMGLLLQKRAKLFFKWIDENIIESK